MMRAKIVPLVLGLAAIVVSSGREATSALDRDDSLAMSSLRLSTTGDRWSLWQDDVLVWRGTGQPPPHSSTSSGASGLDTLAQVASWQSPGNTFTGGQLFTWDLNNDGVLDLCYSNWADTTYAYEATGDNQFQKTHQIANPVGSYNTTLVCVGDADADGRAELVYSSGTSGVHRDLFILESSDPQSYPTQLVATIPEVNISVNYMRLGDLDGDGNREYIGSAGGTSGARVAIWENLGDNVYTQVYAVDLLSAAGEIALGDFDQDGRGDLVVSTLDSKIHVIESTGNDQYSEVWSQIVPQQNVFWVAAGPDLDRDGQRDFAVLGGTGWGDAVDWTVFLYEADGPDSYGLVWSQDLFGSFIDGGLATGDIDGDGFDELLVQVGGLTEVYRAVGDNDLEATWSHSGPVNGQRRHRIIAPDLDGDGNREAVWWTSSNPGTLVLYESTNVPLGACCDPTVGGCNIKTSGACAAVGGLFQGAYSTCWPSPCSIVRSCILPGEIVVTDLPGTSDVPPVPSSEQDLRLVSIAEPFGNPIANGDVLVFTMKVAGLDPAALPPNAFWRTIFTTPLGSQHYVAMIHCVAGGVSYEYGHLTTGSVTDGLADQGTFSADGTIQITLDRNKIAGLEAGETLTGVHAVTGDIAGDCPPGTATVYTSIDTSDPGTYRLVGNEYCRFQTVSCPPSFTEEPGDHPLGFTVNNPSTAWRTYSVSLSDTDGWLLGGPYTDVLVGPVGPGASASFPVLVRTPEQCNPAIQNLLTWTVEALDLPASTNVASCQTTVTCFQSTTAVQGGAGAFSFGLLGSNPFRGETRFAYTLPKRARVEVEVFSVQGKRLRTLVNREQAAGTHSVALELREKGAASLGAGVYLVRITAGNETRNLRVVGFD